MRGQMEELRAVHGEVWDLLRRGVTYVAVRRLKLKPPELYAGLSNRVEKKDFAAFKAELDAQAGLYNSLIDYRKKPAG